MDLLLRQPMTLAEFLAWEEREERKFEFDGLRPVAMTDETIGNSMIRTNLTVALHSRLRGRTCQYLGSLKFLTAEGTVRYPDGMVVCTPVDRRAKFIENPTLVFEVLSPSTTQTDRIEKAREYQATPSVQRYVMLEQDGVAAVVYVRRAETWTHEILVADSSLALPEIGVELPLAELYEGVSFAPDEDNAPGAGLPADAGPSI